MDLPYRRRADGTGLLRAAILVPYRASSPERVAAWQHSRHYLEHLGLPIVVADSEGEWNRAQAINRAAAGAWDVAAIVDADTVQEPAEVLAAIGDAHRTGAAVVPWNVRYKLSREGSLRFIAAHDWYVPPEEDLDAEDPTPRELRVVTRGGTIVVAREAWEAAGGFDERFVGWGHEDVAFRIACQMLAPGGLRETPGTLWHLWHERAPRASRESERLRWDYLRAARNPRRLAALLSR